MLVDDNHEDNWYHQIIIEEMNITERIEVALDGAEALEFLKKESQIIPDLIFLDINMPKINGWEFLEQYKDLSPHQKVKIIVVMLTTSYNPKDLERAKQIEEVAGFNVKPLTHELLTEILQEHFPDHL